MNRIVAAVHDSDTAVAVIEAARRLAQSDGGTLEAVVVANDEPLSPRVRAAADGIPLHVLHGEPETELIGLAGDPETSVIVIGARDTDEGPTPAGHVTIDLVTSSACPVLVVPVEPVTPDGPFQRVICPLEGSSERSSAVEERIEGLLGNVEELIALHVFDPETVPAFWDQPQHETEAWSTQFRSEHLPPAQPRLAAGEAGTEILEAIRRERSDLIVVVWAQEMAPGRAAVVRRLLTESPVPILLIPER